MIINKDNIEFQEELLSVHPQDIPNPKPVTRWSVVWKPPFFLLLALVGVVLPWGLLFLSYVVVKHMGLNIYEENTRGGRWGCLANGTPVLDAPYSTNWDFAPYLTHWNFSEFFEITLGCGRFTFNNAKLIDVGWDIVIGRGGQLLLALLSYRIINSALLHSMETHPRSMPTFVALSFDQGSFVGIWALLKEYWGRHRTGKALLTMLLISLTYVAVFPTFVSFSMSPKCHHNADLSMDFRYDWIYFESTVVG